MGRTLIIIGRSTAAGGLRHNSAAAIPPSASLPIRLTERQKDGKTMAKLTDIEVKELFATIDADGDGEIRLRELRDYGQNHGGTLQDMKLADFVRGADSDGDRKITLAEFTSFFA